MNQKEVTWIDPRDKPGLLRVMMEECAGDSKISFEGSLGDLSFYRWASASYKETGSLKRQTIAPELDFVVLPLDQTTFPRIWKELSRKDHLVHEGVIHVQIEKAGNLVFGGYDNFHRECTVAYTGIPKELLECLKSKGIIRSYEQPNS